MSGRIIVAGGSGFIGRALVKELKSAGYNPQVLGRGKSADIQWDARTLGPWSEHISGAAAVINLVGENVAQPWTPDTKRRIVESRVDATRVLRQAIEQAQNPPASWVQGSAVGFYGDRGDEILTENSEPGPADQFLVDTCLKWEPEASSATLVNTQVSLIRTGFVIGNDGGAFPLLAKLTRSFLGGAVGSGKQWVPWIHVQDIARLMVWAIGREGPFNGVAPNPVTNADMMATLRKVSGRPWSPPAPSFGLSLFKALGGPEPTVALVSSRVQPMRALKEGFQFHFNDLESAVKDLLKS